MKLYFILSVIVFMAALTKAEYSHSEFSGIYADTSLKCPVTGDVISGEHIMFRYIDKDVKFCNDGCVMAFKKEPAKFSEHVKCMPCNDDDGKLIINTTHNGVKYYFCGEGCKGKFESEPEAYLKKFMK
ncbi:MAG TPA: YHS domain-containing protein [Ignavibacteria bacterium]|nr:YHS domain-containing protein [Ignavibacteria bacterium]HMQ98592.1 YHS domain-containing protein [Ignavibacteria bacterium]